MKTHSAFIYQGQRRNRVQKLCLVNFSFQTNLHTKRKTALNVDYPLYQHLKIWGRRIMSSSSTAWGSKWDLILKQEVYGGKKPLVCDSRKHSIVQYSNMEKRNALKIGMQHTAFFCMGSDSGRHTLLAGYSTWSRKTLQPGTKHSEDVQQMPMELKWSYYAESIKFTIN